MTDQADSKYPDNSGYAGLNWFQSGGSAYKNIDFVVRAILAGEAFSSLVVVRSCTNSGGLSPVGTVSVQPMVNQVDGLGHQMPHGTIYNIPYMRLQGGSNAVIIDPQVGDIGLAVFCDRDISVVKNTKAVGGPGSWRQNSHSDGLYLGGFLNGTPTQYVRFSSAGIDITSPTAITLTAPNVTITGTLTNNGHAVGSTHEHTGVQTGSGTSGPPV